MDLDTVSVVGWEGFYTVDRLGVVRSLPRRVSDIYRGQPRTRVLKERVMKPTPTKRGYWAVRLCKEGKGRTIYVHRIVLEAFVGPRPPGMEGCHWDGVTKNNSLANLRWDTPQANVQDNHRLGVYGRNRKKESK